MLNEFFWIACYAAQSTFSKLKKYILMFIIIKGVRNSGVIFDTPFALFQWKSADWYWIGLQMARWFNRYIKSSNTWLYMISNLTLHIFTQHALVSGKSMLMLFNALKFGASILTQVTTDLYWIDFLDYQENHPFAFEAFFVVVVVVVAILYV